MKFLNDEWNRSGNTMEEFKTEIKDLAANTLIEKINMDNFNFLSIMDTGTELSAFPLNTKNLWRKTKLSLSLKKYPVDKLSIEAFYDETTAAEAVKNGLMVFFTDKKVTPAKSADMLSKGTYIPVSEKAIGTIANRVKYGGNSFFEPGLIRDLLIANKFSKPITSHAVLRVDPETGKSKVFAVMSDKYTVISQDTILEIIDRVKEEAEKDLGTTECNNWLIDHSVTRVYLDFPECGKDFTEEYKLPDEMIPGVMIETSDIGDSALRLKGYFRLGGNLTYTEKEFTQVHTGELKMADIIKTLTDSIFPEYRIYPEKLAKLIMIDITDASMSKAVRIKKMTSIYRDISRKIGLVKAIGKKREKPLLDQLIAGINPEIDYTAYDIAQTFLTLSNSIVIENKSVIESISSTARRVMDYKFDGEDDEILVV